MADQPPTPDPAAPAAAAPTPADPKPTENAAAEAAPMAAQAVDDLVKQAEAAVKAAGPAAGESSAPAPDPAAPTTVAEAPAASVPADAPATNAPDPIAAVAATEQSIEELLKQANFEDASAVAPGGGAPDAETFKLPSFQQVMADAQVSSIDLLRDVELNVKIELGRSRMLVEDVLKLTEGSVVELDKLAGDPVDVFVNDRLVARGEVLVLNDNFCVRVNEIVAGAKEGGL
jgi:flagellar motor switch protein FliN/FliY